MISFLPSLPFLLLLKKNCYFKNATRRSQWPNDATKSFPISTLTTTAPSRHIRSKKTSNEAFLFGFTLISPDLPPSGSPSLSLSLAPVPFFCCRLRRERRCEFLVSIISMARSQQRAACCTTLKEKHPVFNIIVAMTLAPQRSIQDWSKCVQSIRMPSARSSGSAARERPAAIELLTAVDEHSRGELFTDDWVHEELIGLM